jgi:LacI family transcriptional regulator
VLKTTPTIYDVAKTAGVSIATVSRVLNEPQKVNEETRQVVFDAISQLGYVPKAEARARALRDVRRIGVIAPFFTAPSFVQRLRGVAEALSDISYELVVYTADTMDRVNSYLETLPLTANLSGIIFLSVQINELQVERLLERKIEAVLVEASSPFFNSVEIDNRSGGVMVADYLLSKGYERFAFIGTNFPGFGLQPEVQRLQGFRERLKSQGVDLSDDRVFMIPYTVEEARRITLELLDSPEPPQAIFSGTDLQAMGVLKAARDRHLRIPQELAVVGFDDLDVADYVGLTTISQHLDESGRLAANMMLSRLADPVRPIQHIHLPLSLIIRDSA